MKVFIDEEEFVFPETTESKSDIFSKVNEEIARRGRSIKTIEVDGTLLDQDAFLALVGGAEARFESIPVRELIKESLAEGAAYVERLSSGLSKIADLLEEEKTAEALDLLRQASEGIEWVLQVTRNCQALLGISDKELDDGNIGEVSDSFIKELQKASSSIEEGKFLELSYHIRTGVLPGIQRLRRYIVALLEASQASVQ